MNSIKSNSFRHKKVNELGAKETIAKVFTSFNSNEKNTKEGTGREIRMKIIGNIEIM